MAAATIASSFTWSDIFEQARQFAGQNMQLGDQDVKLVQMVSSTIYTYYPWKFTLVNSAPGLIPLTDGVQDYARIANCYRLTQASIWRTDQTPNQVRDIDVTKNLSVDLYPRSYVNIRAVSDETPSSVFRLEGAIQVATGMALELRTQFQPYLQTVTSLDQQPWFADEYVSLAQEGIIYKLWQFGQDERAGSASYGMGGQVSYSGQLAVFMGAMKAMATAEDANAIDSLYPEDCLAPGRTGNPGPLLLGW